VLGTLTSDTPASVKSMFTEKLSMRPSRDRSAGLGSDQELVAFLVKGMRLGPDSPTPALAPTQICGFRCGIARSPRVRGSRGSGRAATERDATSTRVAFMKVRLRLALSTEDANSIGATTTTLPPRFAP